MAVVPWKRFRYLRHPELENGVLRVEWLYGRWVPQVVNFPNGQQEYGQEALSIRDLALREPYHPIPKIISKKG